MRLFKNHKHVAKNNVNKRLFSLPCKIQNSVLAYIMFHLNEILLGEGNEEMSYKKFFRNFIVSQYFLGIFPFRKIV